MFATDDDAASRGPASRRAAGMRAVAIAGLVSFAAFGLSACRQIGPEADAERARQEAAKAKVERAQAAPTQAGIPTAPAGDPLASATADEPDEIAPDTAAEDAQGAEGARSVSDAQAAKDAEAAQADAEAAAQAAQERPDGAARAGEDPGEVEVKSERARSPKPIDPWRLVGQPYLVDDEAPAASPDGLTTFTLWFRTKGEFRGVRQGTSITDDRHYKVGLITFPELPGYVPGGIGMLQRSDRMLERGRYCYTAEVHLEGDRGNKRFPIRRDGAELQVEMDLKGAPVQRRTVTVVVRRSADENPPLTPVEKQLACRPEPGD